MNLDHFEKVKCIGRGTFGKVLLVRHKKTNKFYAMKSIHKSKIKNKN